MLGVLVCLARACVPLIQTDFWQGTKRSDEMVKGVSESKGKPMTVTKSHANVSRQQLSTCCKEHQRA